MMTMMPIPSNANITTATHGGLTLFALRAPAPQAIAALRDLAADLPAITDATDRIAAQLDALLQAIRIQAQRHKRTVMVGRTHGIHAEPFINRS